MSIKGNTVTLLDECKEVGNQELDRSDAPLDIEGVIFIGNQMSSDAPFQGDLQDIMIVGDAASAYEMCRVYRPDCKDAPGKEADIPNPEVH